MDTEQVAIRQDSSSLQQITTSIIIPCYNSAWSLPHLAESLKSVLSDNTEVVFVDDGSTDNSLALFQSLIPTAICLRQENQGLGATRNKAAQVARGEFLQLLDADDTIEPGKLEAQAAYAREHQLDVVYSDWHMVIVDESEILPEPLIRAEAPGDVVEALLGGWWFPPNAALIRREAFLNIGGCDSKLGDTCEDFDLWVRLGIAGALYGYLPGHFANYYRYRQVRSMSRRNPRAFFSGEEFIIRKALQLLEEQQMLTASRRRAAARRLHAVARNVYMLDMAWFERLLSDIFLLDPGFQPSGSRIYQATARVLGLKRAEQLAVLRRSHQRSLGGH